LLRDGVQFVDILFIFGRYYPNVYDFVADFNLVVAKDVRKMYD
jgi:hypothetical protein